jgi:hypothetical protein
MMKRDLVEIGTSMLGGLGLGAIGMYLFDPDKGMNRRRMIRRQTHEMIDDANRRLHYAGSRVMHLRDEAANYAGQAGQKMRRLRDEAGEYLHRGQGRMKNRLSSVMPDENSSSAMPTVLAVAGALALGGAMMYLMDPVSGRRRRARIRDKATHYAHETTDTFSSTGRHLRNRAKGVYHEATGMLHRHAHNGGHQLGAVEEKGQSVNA